MRMAPSGAFQNSTVSIDSFGAGASTTAAGSMSLTTSDKAFEVHGTSLSPSRTQLSFATLETAMLFDADL